MQLAIIIDQEYDLLRALSPEEHAPVFSAVLGAGQCLVVMPEEDPDIYQPVIDFAQRYGCQTALRTSPLIT